MIRAALLAALILAAATPAGAQSDAKLFQALDRALPHKAPTMGPRLTQQQGADWKAAVEAIGSVAARSSGTAVEPYALFYLGNALFNTDQIDEALAVFKDLQERFPEHPLNSVILPGTEKSMVAGAVADCAAEIAFRSKHEIKLLPEPELDDSLKAVLHTSEGDVTLKFFENAAPKHRENFLKLAREGFYDRTAVFRIQPDVSVYMGCPLTKERQINQWGRGDPGYTLEHEISRVSHEAGVVTALQANRRRRSHGSQFQILLTDRPNLDFLQTPFAKVVDGLDVMRRVSVMQTNQYRQPVEKVYINGVSIEKTGGGTKKEGRDG